MDATVLAAVIGEIKQRGIGYVVADANLTITAVYGDPHLFQECAPSAIGLPLVETVPELVGSENVLAALLNGSAERLQFDIVGRDLADDRLIYLRLTDLPYRNEQGQISGIVHLLEDISTTAIQQQQVLQQRNELALLQQQLNKALDTLAAANDELSQAQAFSQSFIAIAAHQLGEPLTAIRGFVELMLQGAFGTLSEAQLLHLQSVSQGSEQLQRVIASLIGMLQIASKQIHPTPQPTELADLINEVLADLEQEILRKAIQVVRHMPDNLPPVLCDTNQIVTVLRNILRIAVTCAPEAGELRIRLDTMLDQDRVRLRIHYDAMNLTNAELQQIAVPSSDYNRLWISDQQGDVLEVFMALALIRLQNGEIYIDDTSPEADLWVVTLPITQMGSTQ